MTIEVYAGISLRNDDGVHFGTLVRIRTGLAGVQTDALYQLGDRLEFQLDLTGFDATVHGLAEVIRADPRSDELSSYLLRIRKMRRTDQGLLQEWYEQQAAGDDPTLLGRDDPRALDSQVESQLPSAVGVDMPAPPSPAASHGRSAIRALLLDAAQHPEAADTTGGSATDEPSVSLDNTATPPRLLVSYRTQGAWQRDLAAQLTRSLLFVPVEDDALGLDTELDVEVQRPAQPPLSFRARVVLLHERGVGLSLDLDPAGLNAP
jgi:hypothetical protein